MLLFQKLKEAKKNPVFMLKHIKDIRSPIAVAQQKQAARKASSETSSVKSPPLTSASPASQGVIHHQSQPSQDRPIPPKLHVERIGSVAPGLNTGGVNGSSGWPDIGSPAVESSKDHTDDFSGRPESSKTHASLTTASSHTLVDSSDSATVANVREIPPSTGVSYAVAIYPYMAEQEDEFDVVV